MAQAPKGQSWVLSRLCGLLIVPGRPILTTLDHVVALLPSPTEQFSHSEVSLLSVFEECLLTIIQQLPALLR